MPDPGSMTEWGNVGENIGGLIARRRQRAAQDELRGLIEQGIKEGTLEPAFAVDSDSGLIKASFKPKKKELNYQLTNEGGTDNINSNVPEGYEVVEINSRGPVIKKIKPNVQLLKFEDQQQKDEKIKTAQSQQVKDSASNMVDTISEVESGINNFGLFGKVPSIPGTKRADWEANVNKLLSQKIVDLMASMKNASKTGATGFGQLSEKELKVLQDASTALNRGLSPQDAQKYLDQMKNMANKVLISSNQVTNTSPVPVTATPAQPQGGRQQYSLGQIISGPDGKKYKIIGGDPADPDVEEVE